MRTLSGFLVKTMCAASLIQDLGEFMGQLSPPAVLLFYLSLSSVYPERMRLDMARRACWVAGGLLGFFALTGELFFQTLRIGSYTLFFAGGIILYALGFRLLNDQMANISASEEKAGVGEIPSTLPDISLIPLALPLIAHPSAILFLIRAHSAARNSANALSQHLLRALTVGMAIFLLYLLLFLVSKGLRWLHPVLLKLCYRLSGLFLLAMALQLIMLGLQEARLSKF
jgi:multiple antibiotic resistance protein